MLNDVVLLWFFFSEAVLPMGLHLLHASSALTLLLFLHVGSIWLVSGDAVRRKIELPDCQCFGFVVPWSSAGLFTTKRIWHPGDA
jgi:hypothetical protein